MAWLGLLRGVTLGLLSDVSLGLPQGVVGWRGEAGRVWQGGVLLD